MLEVEKVNESFID